MIILPSGSDVQTFGFTMSSSQVPESLKPVVKFLKCAEQHDSRDVVVAYFCRLCAFQKGYALKESSPISKSFLSNLMSKLEEMKASHAGNESITSETVGLAHLEAYAIKLFQFAYNKDLNADFSKATVQSFLTAGVLLDVATTLGQPTDDLEKMRKYAKWKTLYITNCQKNGEVPIPGPAAASEDADLAMDFDFSFPEGLPTAKAPQAPPAPTQPKPAVDPSVAPPPVPEASSPTDSNQIGSEVYVAVEKHLRFALSALQYQDKKSVIDNLHKALQLISN